ncbi:MAG: hypothetical protein M1823_005824 [Watsoniomyces obsoletus]|nr:MAG: hypothetical protein M1823_005824 [Watsoniomyces obsoletus]
MAQGRDTSNCTLSTCDIKDSVYEYRPSVAANSILLALFGLSLIAHVAQGWIYRQRAYAILIFFGCLAEIIGYVGRLISWNNPFSETGFLTQICCLTLAPAFFSAAIYICIAKIVNALGTDISRISPRTYLWLFVPCDIVSLSLQGAGGGISSTRAQNNEDPKLGSDIAIAGLVFQVATLTLFMILCAEYAVRFFRSHGWSLARARAEVPLLSRRSFQLFLVMLYVATICIFIRSVYRVIELAGGWDGELIHDQTLFIILEGVMVIIAAIALNVGHPGPAMPQARISGEKTEETA